MRNLWSVVAAAATFVACSTEAPVPAGTRGVAPLQTATVGQPLATVDPPLPWGKGLPPGVLPTRPVRDAARAAVPARALGPFDPQYFGGPVVQNPKIVAVYWGAIDATRTASLPTFYSDIVNSTYVDWLAEYNTYAQPPPTTNQGIARGLLYGGTFTITPGTSGTTVTDVQIQAELFAQITAGKLPKPTLGCDGFTDTIYMLDFPAGVTIIAPDGTHASCTFFCAYHSTTTATIAVNGSAVHLLYGVHPFIGAGSGCEGSCGAGGAVSYLDNVTEVHSHELIETMTDPQIGLATGYFPPLAWYTAQNTELSDICAGQATSAGTVAVNGRTWTVQKAWSNKKQGCIVAGAAIPPCTAPNTPPGCRSCFCSDVACSCTPLTQCSGGQTCGFGPNGCGGTITCGTCAPPQTCVGTPSQCCTPKCSSGQCGQGPDGCGGTITCGGCTAPEICAGSQCCTPATACPAGQKCGTASDGCGGTIACTNTCSAPQICAANNCCTPLTACPTGTDCGAIPDGCGGSVGCGECALPKQCINVPPAFGGHCTACATTCPAGQNCGMAPDGCGLLIQCGSCTAPETCGGGGLDGGIDGGVAQCGCTKTTCAVQNARCGRIGDACGGTLDCGACEAGTVCVGHRCEGDALDGGSSGSSGTGSPGTGSSGTSGTPGSSSGSGSPPGDASTDSGVPGGSGGDAGCGCRAVSASAPPSPGLLGGLAFTFVAALCGRRLRRRPRTPRPSAMRTTDASRRTPNCASADQRGGRFALPPETGIRHSARVRHSAPASEEPVSEEPASTVGPHVLGPPPPQYCGAVHGPHWMTPPQPSPCAPHVAPICAHVFGVQARPHWLGVPPPPHVSGAAQLPQSIPLPQPSNRLPQLAPSCAHVVGMHESPLLPSLPPSSTNVRPPPSSFGPSELLPSTPASVTRTAGLPLAPQAATATLDATTATPKWASHDARILILQVVSSRSLGL